VRTTGATRAVRPKGRALVSTSWLLLLVGLSCTYSVGLPGAVGDAGGSSGETGGVQPSDASIDQSGAGDRPWFYHPDGCANPQQLKVLSNTVEMIIALDRSTSMQQHAFDSTTRLQAAQLAIAAAINAHPGILFGLELFPSSTGCNGASCCAGSVSVQPAANQSTSIATQMACGSGDAGCSTAGDDSPSPSALRQCHTYFVDEGSQGGRSSQFVLLITDQDPTCAADFFGDGSPCDVGNNEASRLGAKNVGVQAFFVALNSDAQATSCLASMAAANASSFGGNSQFVAVADQQALRDALESTMIAAEANLCRFSLVLPPDNSAQVVVIVNNEKVQLDPTGQQGWKYSDATSSEVVLSGSACSQLTSGQGDSKPTVLACWQ
jgi:hypothetical protein